MIDDDPHMHRIVGIYLKDKPYELVNVQSARMALHKLDEQLFEFNSLGHSNARYGWH